MLKRAYGCLIGSAIGDAMGMPASFMSPEKIKRIYGRITNFLPPSHEQLAHQNLAEGTITDDTGESLILASVLIEAGGYDEPLFIEKMKNWALESKILDTTIIGPSTRRFLEVILLGGNYLDAGKSGDTNGGAMRVAPVGIFYHRRVDRAIDAAIASARPSHGSKPGLASAAAIAAAVAVAVEGGSRPDEAMAAAIRGAEAGERAGFDIPSPSVACRIKLATELVDRNRAASLEQISYILYQYIGAGMKSYESIPFSLGIFYAANGDYQDGLLAAINTGDDADTNGAIVGALCGAYSGSDRINPAWIEKLQAANQLDLMEVARKLIFRGDAKAQGLQQK